MSDFDPAPLLSTVISIVLALVAIVWLLPLAVNVAWQVIPSIVMLILIIGAIRGIISRLFD